jgi:hypothetical protein
MVWNFSRSFRGHRGVKSIDQRRKIAKNISENKNLYKQRPKPIDKLQEPHDSSHNQDREGSWEYGGMACMESQRNAVLKT